MHGYREARPGSRILVCVYSWYYFRQIRPVIDYLAQEGHTIHVVSIIHDRDDFQEGILEICTKWPNVTFQVGPERRDIWAERAIVLRQLLCFIQSRDPRFDQACRSTDEARLRRRHPAIFDAPFFRHSRVGRELAWRLLQRCAEALPTDPAIDAVFSTFHPDVMMITPLIDRLGGMWDYMASARKVGVRTVFPVHSWDNLSSKARVNTFPDLTLVWNETQVDEARRFHRVPKRSIQITGAQGFDNWFEMQPRMSRQQFCSELGFDPEQPILLYVCSAILKRHMSPTIATSKTELPYFTRWIEALRSSGDERLRRANIIVRPHPKRQNQWDDVDLSKWGAVAVYPRQGGLPNSAEAKAIFYDSMYYSAAVIGINTSAMIECAIVGRPVLTVLDPDYAGGQVDMQHFQYLLKTAGGLLETSPDYESHVRELSYLLDHPEAGRHRAEVFVRAFVRPLGTDQAATPIFAEAVLDVAALGPRRPRRRGIIDRLLTLRMKTWKPDERPTLAELKLTPARLRRKQKRRAARRAAREKVSARSDDPRVNA